MRQPLPASLENNCTEAGDTCVLSGFLYEMGHNLTETRLFTSKHVVLKRKEMLDEYSKKTL